MVKTLRKDTLAYQFGARPNVIPKDMGWVLVPSAVQSLNAVMGNSANIDTKLHTGWTEETVGHPEVDGLVFYMMNHAVSVISQRVNHLEPLGEYLQVVEEYHRQLAVRSTRMFFYLLLICTRESRHEHTDYNSPLWDDLNAKYGPNINSFHSSIKGKGSSAAADRLRNYPPQATLGKYTEFLSEVFHTGKYSSGYGGKAWGAVADCLKAYVHGHYSAEMMMDTAFTLCHNNGPIFNKGMLFDAYSNDIYKLLDVQRSGQIPQLIASKGIGKSSHPRVQELYNLCLKVIGPEFEGYVDWYMVEALGSLHQYPQEKKDQASKYGIPTGHKALMDKQAEIAKAKQEAEEAEEAAEDAKQAEEKLKAQAELSKHFVEIMPKLLVKKVEVPRE